MPLLGSRPAAAMLAATAIPVPVLLVAANEAAGSAHARIATAAHHSPAARDAKAKRRVRAAHHPGRAGSTRPSGAGRSAPGTQTADHAQTTKRAHRTEPAGSTRGARTAAPAPGAKTTAWRPAKTRRAAVRTARSRSWRLAFGGSQKAHTANDPADTISDFKFTPGTLTIHVGDTVTWTNDGPTEHTATADDGSFNTGTLKKGRSASHTFTKAGTFAYICAIHPFMKGTIVVQASAASTTSPSTTSPSTTSPSTTTPSTAASSNGSAGSSSSSAASTTSDSAATASGSTLPVTGFDLAGAMLCGLTLIGLGLGLRRRAS